MSRNVSVPPTASDRPEPLAVNPDEFWHPKTSIPDLFDDVTLPKASAALHGD